MKVADRLRSGEDRRDERAGLERQHRQPFVGPDHPQRLSLDGPTANCSRGRPRPVAAPTDVQASARYRKMR